MKKLSVLILLLVLIVSTHAQNKICRYEYWVDDDYAGRVAVNIAPVANLHLQTNLSLDQFSVGFHLLNIRFKDSKGLWSGVATQYITISPPGNTVTSSIIGYEYWVDDGYQEKVFQSVTAGQNFRLSDHLDMAGFPVGFHLLNIRFKDNKGIWSGVTTQFFQKNPTTHVESNDVYAYRFWFDDDLSSMETIRLAQPLKYIHLVDSIETPFLAVGNHLFNYQFEDSLKAYSSARADTFNVVSCLPHGGRAIAGTDSLCVGQTGLVYSINKIKNADTYTWSVPSGATIVYGNNTPAITVDYNPVAVSGDVSVYATNVCGNGDTMIFPITVYPLPDPTLAGADTVCAGNSGSVYATESGKSNYTWSVSPGNEISAGGTATSPVATVTWNTPGDQWIRVNYSDVSGCSDTTDTQFSVFVNSPPAPAITGPASVCQFTSRNYSTESGMSNYYWQVSSGGTITGSHTGNSVTVNWGSASTQWVKVNYTGLNGCTASEPTISHVVVNVFPAAAGMVSGPVQVVQGQTGVGYSVSPISNAEGYSWSLPPGATIAAGDNTSSIMVDFGSTAISGGICVQGANSCGNGNASQTFLVRVIPSSVSLQNVTIGSGQMNCNSAAQTIHVAGDGTTFSVQSGGFSTMIAGRNIIYLPTVSVAWGGYMHGYITANGQFCGTQPPAMMATTGSDDDLLQEDGMWVKVFPNPTPGRFKLEVLDKSLTGDIDIAIYSMQGFRILSQKFPGENSQEFSIADRPAGLYIIQIITGTKSETVKILKE
jgi:hypothetical protein